MVNLDFQGYIFQLPLGRQRIIIQLPGITSDLIGWKKSSAIGSMEIGIFTYIKSAF